MNESMRTQFIGLFTRKRNYPNRKFSLLEQEKVAISAALPLDVETTSQLELP